MKFHIAVERSSETVFELIRNLNGYKSWLPASEVFMEIIDISDYPVKIGTTYVDKGSATKIHGEVTEMEPPKLIAFQQTMNFKRGMLSGSSTISVRYSLQEAGGRKTLVTRELKMRTTGVFMVTRPVLAMVIRKENERILRHMKTYLEARVT